MFLAISASVRGNGCCFGVSRSMLAHEVVGGPAHDDRHRQRDAADRQADATRRCPTTAHPSGSNLPACFDELVDGPGHPPANLARHLHRPPDRRAHRRRRRLRRWDRLAGDDDPFLEHAFLAALEASGSVGERAGCAAALRAGARPRGKRLVGAVPLYLKSNSYGEFIFDWGWANAAHRAGVRYYPKLVAAIPFTPVTGRRLMVLAEPDVDAGAVTAALLRGIAEVAEAERASSVHVLFCTEEEKQRAGRARLRAASVDAVPLAQPRRAAVRELRRLPDDVPVAKPQAGAQGTPDRGRARPPLPHRDGRRAGRPRLGRAARALSRQHRAPRGHPVPDRPLLRRRARRAGAPGGRDAGLPRRRRRSRARSTSRRGRTSTAATGAAWTTSRCCTSSSATTA